MLRLAHLNHVRRTVRARRLAADEVALIEWLAIFRRRRRQRVLESVVLWVVCIGVPLATWAL